jgi:hypothetical protein
MGGSVNYLEWAKYIGGVEPSLTFSKILILNWFIIFVYRSCYTYM